MKLSDSKEKFLGGPESVRRDFRLHRQRNRNFDIIILLVQSNEY